MATPVLEVKNLTVELNNLTILEDVSFQVERGDILGIVGPNGGGKTTLLRAILGLVPIKKGEIRLFGVERSRFHDYQKIAFVAQNATQFDPIFPATVKEIVSLGCLSRSKMGKPLTREDHHRVQEAIELVDLKGLENRRISDLSGGQRQRVLIARAMVKEPELLILDEAATGLDIQIHEKFLQMLKKIHQESGITILLVSHDLSAVFCQANKVACINKKLHFSQVNENIDPTRILRTVYGEHFTFLFHQEECKI